MSGKDFDLGKDILVFPCEFAGRRTRPAEVDQ